MPRTAEVTVRVADTEQFQRLLDFAQEYAWHRRECAAVDADGEWHKGNPECDCGYDEDLARVLDA